MIRIAYDITAWAISPFGGIAQACFHTLDQAAQHRELSTVGYYRRGSPRAEVAPSAELRRLRCVNGVIGHRYDIVHSLCHRLLRTRSKASVYTAHDAWSLHPNQWQPPAFQRKLGRRLRRDLSRVDLVIADSDYTRDRLIALDAVPPDRCLTVPLGCEPPHEVTGTAASGSVAGLEPRRFVLYVGRLENRKNLPHVCEAVGPLADLTLVLVGEPGHGFEETVQPHLALFPSDRLRVCRHLPARDLNWLYRHALATMLPSWEEGFGLPVLEAMAHGSPVIAAGATAIPEVAGAAAILVHPSDAVASRVALLQLQEDSALRERMIARGIERASLFTWERYFAALIEVYRRLLP